MMLRFRWFFLLLILPVMFFGCGPSSTTSPRDAIRTSAPFGYWTEKSLVVNGIDYGVLGMSGRDENDALVYSFALVFPNDQAYFPAVTFTEENMQGHICFEEYLAKTDEHGAKGRALSREYFTEDAANSQKIADVAFGKVYFVDDRKIVLQKSYDELGLDVSDPKNAFNMENLKPVLENMLREHFASQQDEAETEPRSELPE